MLWVQGAVWLLKESDLHIESIVVVSLMTYSLIKYWSHARFLLVYWNWQLHVFKAKNLLPCFIIEYIQKYNTDCANWQLRALGRQIRHERVKDSSKQCVESNCLLLIESRRSHLPVQWGLLLVSFVKAICACKDTRNCWMPTEGHLTFSTCRKQLAVYCMLYTLLCALCCFSD